MSDPIPVLLSALFWPSDHLTRRGTLTWVNAMDEDTRACAQVIVQDNVITVQGWRQVGARALLPHLEARWAKQGKDLNLVHATRFGLSHPLDAPRLLADFHREVLLLGVRPTFQAMKETWMSTTPPA